MEGYIVEQLKGWGDVMLSLILTEHLITIDNKVENRTSKEEVIK